MPKGCNSCRATATKFIVRAALVLVILCIPTTGQAQIDNIKTLFHSAKYDELVPRLKEYRRKLKNQGVIDLQVDFMLSASMCRVSASHEKGLKALRVLKKAYRNLSSDDLDIINGAIRSCTSGNLMVASLPTGGSRVSGKGGRQSEILSQLSDMWSDRYRKRIFPQTQRGEAIESIGRLVGAGYNLIPTTRFVLVSQQDETEIFAWGDTMERVLTSFLSQYGMPPPANLITVYLFANKNRMADHAEKFHGIALPRELWAYTFPQDSSITIWTSGGMGTVGHEVFHALLNQHSPYAPPWLNEGVASLYEEFRTIDGRVEGTYRPDHWRVRHIRGGSHVDLEELLEMDWVVFDGYSRFRRNHATAKFFAMYLQEKGLIERVVNGFTDYDPVEGDADAVAKLENLVGMEVSTLSQDFVQWLAEKVGAEDYVESEDVTINEGDAESSIIGNVGNNVKQQAGMAEQTLGTANSSGMGKNEIIEEISKNANISIDQAKIALDTVIDSIIDGVKVDGKVTLVGFGTFSKYKRKARKSRNAQIGEPHVIKAANAVKFKPGKKFIEAVR